MAWFSDLAGKAESLLNNIDEQAGAALRNNDRGRKQNGPLLEPLWQNKKLPARKKETGRSLYTSPTRKPPPAPNNHSSRATMVKTESQNQKDSLVRRRSPTRRKSQQYDLNNCPRTLVGDIKPFDDFGMRPRRYSLPTELTNVEEENFTYRMQNLEVENAMLKNELNVMNKEVSDLIDRLRKNEDGNTVEVDSKNHELSETYTRLEDLKQLNGRANSEIDTLKGSLSLLKQKINDLTDKEMEKSKQKSIKLETEISLLKDEKKDLCDRIKQMEELSKEFDIKHKKLESDYRQAQSTVKDLESNLERSSLECSRIEKDWESYKIRVKNMLFAKDQEIKALQEGIYVTEDAKMLIDQIDNLKEERDELSSAMTKLRNEYGGMKAHISQLEARSTNAERLVSALREALREERGAKNSLQAECVTLSKEIKLIQMETGQTIATLRSSLHEKDAALERLNGSASSGLDGAAPSALNVADCESASSRQVQSLTRALLEKQARIDQLLADTNTMKIQMDKMQTKHKAELSSLRASHSVVQLHDHDEKRARSNRNITDSSLNRLSLRLGVFIKRYPIFRIFIIFYMIGLHFWVLTVLLNSSPDYYTPKKVPAR